MNANRIKIDEVDSTNNYARRLIAEKGAGEGTVVLAQYQLNGKGVGANFWESEKGKNLTFSLILRPTFLDPGKQFYLSMAVSLGICDFVSAKAEGIKIKWPNDIYFSSKKMCGILIENIVQGNLITESIVGIGLNINQEVFVSDAPNPVSLKQITGDEYDLDECFDRLYSDIFKRYELLRSGNYQPVFDEYVSKLFGRGIWLAFKTGEKIFKGKIIGVDEFGQLKIEDRDGQTRLFQFKEVEYIFNGTEF